MKTQHLVAMAAVAVTGGAIAWQAGSTAFSAPSTSAPAIIATTETAPSAPVMDGVMRPSEFPGVETVSIPDAPTKPAANASVSKAPNMKKSADGKSWVRVLPGGKIPEGGYTARNQTTWRRENGKTSLGGIALVPDQNYLLHETARRDENGALVHECVPGETPAQHAKHIAKKPVAKYER